MHAVLIVDDGIYRSIQLGITTLALVPLQPSTVMVSYVLCNFLHQSYNMLNLCLHLQILLIFFSG